MKIKELKRYAASGGRQELSALSGSIPITFLL